MEKLTWRTIKANPIRAIRKIKGMVMESKRSWEYAKECEQKFLKVRDQLHDQASLLGNIKRLESEVYDLKMKANLPR